MTTRFLLSPFVNVLYRWQTCSWEEKEEKKLYGCLNIVEIFSLRIIADTRVKVESKIWQINNGWRFYSFSWIFNTVSRLRSIFFQICTGLFFPLSLSYEKYKFTFPTSFILLLLYFKLLPLLRFFLPRYLVLFSLPPFIHSLLSYFFNSRLFLLRIWNFKEIQQDVNTSGMSIMRISVIQLSNIYLN